MIEIGKMLYTLTVTLIIVVFLLPAQIISSAQNSETKDARYYSQQAMSAYREKNYSSYLENMIMALKLRPGHPTIMYNLAGAHALLGKKIEAIELLGKVADMGLIYAAEKDGDFDSINDSEPFKTILKKFEANRAPVNNSEAAFTIQEKGLLTEGIAYDPVEEVFYISSVHRRKILSVDSSGAVWDFATEKDGLWSAFGMKVDPERHILWVCSAAVPQMSGFVAEEKGLSAIFKYDLKTKKLIKKYSLPDRSKGHLFGDLAINSSGDVFISDSLSPVIYAITRQKDELEAFVESKDFVSLQGIDFSEDGKRIFAADYSRGVWAIEVGSKKISLLPYPETACLLGIDGLYFYRGNLIGIQNGTNPHRLVRMLLNGDLNRIEKVEVIEANNPLFDEPTLGVIVKGQFYYIANSQWGSVDEKGKIAPAEKLREPVILKTRL